LGGGDGGLYDFLPKPADDEVALVTTVETKALPTEDKSKVIFLDIDGVLRTQNDMMERVLVDGEMVPVLPKDDDCDYNKMAFRALRTIVQHTGASIVLSSEWRRTEIMRNAIGVALRTHSLPQVRGCTTTALKPKPEVLKANNMIAFAERRAREIGDWLKHHSEVKAWVVLDDVDLSWGDGVRSRGTPLMKSRVVKTDPVKCLSDKDAQLAIDILCNPPVMTAEQEAGAEKRAARKLQVAYPILKNPDRAQEEASYLPKPIPRRQGF